MPDAPNKPYDMHDAIDGIVDYGDFLEIAPLYAQNVICGFGRINGRSIGIVANQPNVLAGVSTRVRRRRPLDSFGFATRSTFRS